MAIFPYFQPISALLNLYFYLPACIPSVKACESHGWQELELKHQVGTMPGKQREGEQKRWSEKRGGRVKNVIAAEVPGEPDDAK